MDFRDMVSGVDPKDRELAEEELDDLRECENLTNWEVEFVENMDKWLRDGKRMTKSQIESIHKIWNDRVC